MFAGVLVECPEPIERAGRVQVKRVSIGGAEVPSTWDGRRTRLLALVAPEPRPAPFEVGFDVTDTPPGRPSVAERFTVTVRPLQPNGGGP